MQECLNCQGLFKLDINKGLIGQDKCPECAAKVWIEFLRVIGEGGAK